MLSYYGEGARPYSKRIVEAILNGDNHSDRSSNMYLLYDIGLTDDAMEALLNRASELSDEEAAVVAVCRPGLILVRPFQGLGQKILGEGSRSGRGVVGVMHGFVDGDCYYPAVNSICLPSLFIATRNLMRKCGKIQPMVRKR